MKTNWMIFTRGQIPLHRVDIFDQFLTFSKKFYGNDFTKILYINEGDNLWWGLDGSEIKKSGDKLFKILSDKKKYQKHIKKYKDFFKKAFTASYKVRKINLTSLSNSGLVKAYQELDKNNGEASTLANFDLDVFDVMFEDFYQEKIKELIDENITDEDFVYIVKELSVPAFKSFLAKEEIDILKTSLKDVKKLYNKYWWVAMGWENPHPRTLDYYLNAVKKKNKRKLKRLENQEKKTRKKRKEIIGKYKIKSEVNYWLKVLDEYTLLHDLRKEYQIKWMHSSNLLMAESAKRIKCSVNDLVWFRHKEVHEFLRGKKFDKTEANKRKKAICLLVSGGSIKVWSGREAFQQHKEQIKEDNEKIKVVKGRSANSGKVIAVAKVCMGAKDALEKVKKGDVLITGMTLPEYVPAMKRASAIVTNEGGLTCHAAIISRELNIPCIVGTKIAMQVLKDGDLVEVDANKGVVKVIK